MQGFRGLFFVFNDILFWECESGGWEEGFWQFMRQLMKPFMSINGERKKSDGGKKCRVCARFAGAAPFVIKRECEKNYANYTLNYTFR